MGYLVLALITVVFFHPLIVFVALYAIIFFLDRRNAFVSKRSLYIIAGIFFSVILLKTLVFRSPYERQAMGGLKNFITQFPDYFTLYSNKRFLLMCVSKYYWIPILFSGIVLLYCTTRRWKDLLFFLFGIFDAGKCFVPDIRNTPFLH